MLAEAQAVHRCGAQYRGGRLIDDHRNRTDRYRSRMDEVISREFKGTGNSEVVHDRKASDKRVFPASTSPARGRARKSCSCTLYQLKKMNVLAAS